jgi:Na+/phosphate symporter
MIFEHLALNPSQDLPASLALISVVHDVERIGDYCKSLIEIGQWSHVCSSDSRYGEMCRNLFTSITPLFPQALEALRESDADLARQVMRQHEEIKAQTDQVFAVAMEDEEANRDTLLHALGARLLRRVSAHLSNVASSVANPLDRLGDDETT